MVTQCTSINQPLSVAEDINLENSIVSGTNMEMELVKLQLISILQHSTYKSASTYINNILTPYDLSKCNTTSRKFTTINIYNDIKATTKNTAPPTTFSNHPNTKS